MTYKKLLELIEAMSPEQQEMKVIMSIDEWREASVMTTLCHTDEVDGFPIGQPILE